MLLPEKTNKNKVSLRYKTTSIMKGTSNEDNLKMKKKLKMKKISKMRMEVF